MYLTVIAENYGPSAATDVLVFMRLRTEAGDAIGESERRMIEPVWGPGRRRTFMPRRGDQIEALNTLADADLVLELAWEWSDGRRHFWRIGRGDYVRQKRRMVYPLRRFRDDMYGGQALVDPDPLTALPRIHGDLQAVKQSLDKIHGVMDGPGMRTWVEEILGETAPAKAKGRRKTGTRRKPEQSDAEATGPESANSG